MGLFYVKGFLAGPTGQQAEVEFLVDTGATLLVVPRPLAERLALTPTRSQGVMIAGGQREVWPIAEVHLTLDGQATTTPCFIAPAVLPCLERLLWRAFFSPLTLWRSV